MDEGVMTIGTLPALPPLKRMYLLPPATIRSHHVRVRPRKSLLLHARMLTGLIECKCSGDHSCWENRRAMAVACPEDNFPCSLPAFASSLLPSRCLTLWCIDSSGWGVGRCTAPILPASHRVAGTDSK